MGRGDGLGDGGQPLLSASIREPRGDMEAGKRGGRIKTEVGVGRRPETSHPSALECTCLPSHTISSLPAPSVHNADVSACSSESNNMFFLTPALENVSHANWEWGGKLAESVQHVGIKIRLKLQYVAVTVFIYIFVQTVTMSCQFNMRQTICEKIALV